MALDVFVLMGKRADAGAVLDGEGIPPDRTRGGTPQLAGGLVLEDDLDAASRMLAGEASVAEIALACGYADHSAFTRQFRATVGVTPTQYRRVTLR